MRSGAIVKSLSIIGLATALAISLSTAAHATPTCSNQSVVVGVSCGLGSLTFTFEAVSFVGANPSSDTLSLEAPPTGVAGDQTTLGFHLSATYPVDIFVIYEASSTSPETFSLDSTYTTALGPPPPVISQNACGADPTLPAGCTPLLTNFINNTGSETSSANFGPRSTFWIENFITDPGFGDFTNSVEVVRAVPEPLTLSLFAAGLVGAVSMRRRKARR